MGEKNHAICHYLSFPEVFADFINGAVFQGRKEIHAENIRESGQVLYHKKDKLISRTRDVVKYIAGEKEYLIIGVENQNQIHHAMPLRCMEYDVMEYGKQFREIVEENRKQKKFKDAGSYLSGFRVEDKLHPVITFVFYHGNGTYNSCVTLYDMLELNKDSSAYLPYIPDYKMNLISLDSLNERKFQTGLRELFGIMKHSSNKNKLKKYIEENSERMSRLDETTFDTITVMINHKDLQKYKKNYQSEKGEVNMCQAITEMIEEGREEGIERGIAKVVLSMIAKGYPSSMIADMTDIPLDIVQKIEKRDS